MVLHGLEGVGICKIAAQRKIQTGNAWMNGGQPHLEKPTAANISEVLLETARGTA